MDSNNEAQSLFAQIIFFADLKSLTITSQELTNFVKQNSPSVQFLETGFYEVFDQENKEKLIATISSLEKVLMIWNQLKMISICYRGFLKCLFKLKDTLNERNVTQEISNLLLKSWKHLNIFSLKEIMSVWPDWIELLPKKEVIAHINDLICAKDFKTAIVLISQFKLHDDFDRREIVTILMSKNHTDCYELLVKDKTDLEFLQFLLIKLCTNKTVSIASKLIRKFNLSPTDYPEIIDRLRKKHLRYFLREEGWMNCEEKFFSFKEYLGILVDDLIYDKKFDEAYSICKRNSLLENGFIQKIETKNFLNNKNLIEKCTWKPNLVFELDNFEPVEENIKSFVEGTHVNLKDFNIKEEKVIFVDNVSSEAFYLAEKSLLHESTIIGLDSEFLGSSNSFERPGIAIFQIANEENIFIFDMVKLGKEKNFLDLLFGLFSSPNIKKIGHTISADISQLKRTVEIDQNAALRNYFEIPKIYKKLYPGDKYFSLAHITEKIIGKKLSKGDQCSNWNLRPLRRAQLHYSAMDALICIKIYQKFEEECITKKKKILEFSEDIYFDGSKKEEIGNENNSCDSHSENEVEKEGEKNTQKNIKKKGGRQVKNGKDKKEEKLFKKENAAEENDGLFGE